MMILSAPPVAAISNRVLPGTASSPPSGRHSSSVDVLVNTGSTVPSSSWKVTKRVSSAAA